MTSGDLNKIDEVLENALDCVIGVNNLGIITQWNRQAEKSFGWMKSEAIGTDMAELIIPPTYLEQHKKSFELFLKTGTGRVLNKRLELKGLRKNGDEFPIELSVTPIKVNNSFFFYGFIQDITDRVKVLEQLQLAKEQAESANYAKSNFLANMSHEIRTPLAAILGFTELLADPSIKEENKYNFLKAINRNGQVLLNLINEILDISKIESGKLTLDFHDCQLYDLISDVISTLSLKASKKGIKLSVHYDKNIPTIISTDSLKLKQILFNIVGNAIKFTTKGEVQISIHFNNYVDQPPTLEIAVKDTGIGIAREDTDKLFQLFSQVDTSFTRNFGGTGLGLALSKRFANHLGGDILLSESTKNGGSTFTITINPGLSNVQSELNKNKTPQLPTSEPEPLTSPAKTDPHKLNGLRILLAEDSLDNQFLISQLLEKAGAHVKVAENGKIALDMARHNEFDVFLIDIQMPVMDGYSTVTALRKDGLKKPMFALTAHALKGDRERSLLSGFNEHISKPINRNNLIETINNYCDVKI